VTRTFRSFTEHNSELFQGSKVAPDAMSVVLEIQVLRLVKWFWIGVIHVGTPLPEKDPS